MGLNLDWANIDALNIPAPIAQEGNGRGLSGFWDKYGDKITDKAINLGERAIADRLGVNNPAPQMSGDGTIYEGGKAAPVSATTVGKVGFWDSVGGAFANVLQTAGTTYAAVQANREANKNPPYNLYAMAILALAGIYLIIKK